MKRSIIALVAAISIAGAAGASIATRSSVEGKPPMPSVSTAARPAVERPPEPRSSVVARSTPAESPRTSIEARQAPVPLQLKAHPPVKSPTSDATETAASTESATVPSSLAPDQSGETAARAAIEADGYKGVRILSKGDGVWRAKALRGRTEVLLIVDATGSVTTAD